ncbi:hypothetical protein RDWZM_002978 [Blomia tropicalis]|uniref:Intradiol ring-cleavage dioxygenases domain-containing protein n=1 Tax=Blomia tropicalis TaxID=40697 RepID=A0A9Q0MDT2_BLOTA|nr:hypothetical protein RDWZM_002978 [Blomia tropicalis]
MKSTIIIVLLSSLCLIQQTSAKLCARMGRHLLETTCVLTPEGGEGPYYISYPELIRKDIREDRTGLPLQLKFTLTDVTKCEPIHNASIDIWQADPYGFYSSYTKNSPDARRRRRAAVQDEKRLSLGVPHAPPTDNTTFLRGVQFTDENGEAEFLTVFPGWYSSRTPHIHVMAHVNGKTVHVSQIYFKNDLIRNIKRLSPYKQRANLAPTNEADYIFRRDNGHLAIVNQIKPTDGRRISRGLTGQITLGMDPSKTSKKALNAS